MLLKDLIQRLETIKTDGVRLLKQVIGREDDVKCTAIVDDSRAIQRGSVFVAIRGTNFDGHNYLTQAAQAGASVLVVEVLPEDLISGVCYLCVKSCQEALGHLASLWYGDPSLQMKVVGVTGTNGKTTIATLLYRLHMLAGYKVGLLSTVCNYIGDEAVPSTHTTPSALPLQALLARMREAGCSHVFMEVSSHAVDQHRIAGIDFDGGIFTNLSRDHLDYHGSVRAYLYAKKRFFDTLAKKAFALTNLDDKNGEVMLQNTSARRLSYSLRSSSDYKVRILETYPDYTLLEIDGREVSVQLVGTFNAYNLLAVYAASVELGMQREEALRLLSRVRSVDGRLEVLRSPSRHYSAVVDYAHTPDALANVLETLRDLLSQSRGTGQLTCVVGCGGDRDRGKRPIMAAEAVRLADRVILTSDNPRSESPEAILAEMYEGVPQQMASKVLSITDRSEAIRAACMMAGRGDIVLVAGKGHETYQEIQGVRYPFDDREVLRTIFSQENK